MVFSVKKLIILARDYKGEIYIFFTWISVVVPCRVLLQMMMPSSPTTVLISWGSGSHQDEAENHAAIGALEYLKINGGP